jgi:hypothetical protein
MCFSVRMPESPLTSVAIPETDLRTTVARSICADGENAKLFPLPAARLKTGCCSPSGTAVTAAEGGSGGREGSEDVDGVEVVAAVVEEAERDEGEGEKEEEEEVVEVAGVEEDGKDWECAELVAVSPPSHSVKRTSSIDSAGALTPPPPPPLPPPSVLVGAAGGGVLSSRGSDFLRGASRV